MTLIIDPVCFVNACFRSYFVQVLTSFNLATTSDSPVWLWDGQYFVFFPLSLIEYPVICILKSHSGSKMGCEWFSSWLWHNMLAKQLNCYFLLMFFQTNGFFIFFIPNTIIIWEFWQNMKSLTVNNNLNVILLFTASYCMIKKTGNIE